MKNEKSQIKISASAEVCTIDIEGTIGVGDCTEGSDSQSVASYENFRAKVEEISKIDSSAVVVNIRSTGGDVNDALLIHDALVGLKAHVTTRCYGYTASAATLIAQAADEGCREISENCLYMIHNSICATEGNAQTLASRVDLLKKTDERIAAIYAARSGRNAEAFASLMAENNGEGRWLAPDEAIGAGLADRIISHRSDESLVNRVVAHLGSLLGISPEQPLPTPTAESNVHPKSKHHSEVAFDEGQKSAAPTSTAEIEDPSIDGGTTSKNKIAYAKDAMAFHY